MTSALAAAAKDEMLSARAAYVLDWLALVDAAEALRAGAEAALGLDEGHDVMIRLARVERMLRDGQPRLRG